MQVGRVVVPLELAGLLRMQRRFGERTDSDYLVTSSQCAVTAKPAKALVSSSNYFR